MSAEPNLIHSLQKALSELRVGQIAPASVEESSAEAERVKQEASLLEEFSDCVERAEGECSDPVECADEGEGCQNLVEEAEGDGEDGDKGQNVGIGESEATIGEAVVEAGLPSELGDWASQEPGQAEQGSSQDDDQNRNDDFSSQSHIENEPWEGNSDGSVDEAVHEEEGQEEIEEGEAETEQPHDLEEATPLENHSSSSSFSHTSSWDTSEAQLATVDWSVGPASPKDTPDRLNPSALQASLRDQRQQQQQNAPNKKPLDLWTVPFLVQHHFLSTLRTLLERTIHTYLSHHISTGAITAFAHQCYTQQPLDGKLGERDWLGGNVDLPDSVRVLRHHLCWDLRVRVGEEEAGGDLVHHVLSAVEGVRHANVHRVERVSVRELEMAMLLPTLLGDGARARFLEAMWETVRNPPPNMLRSVEQALRRVADGFVAPPRGEVWRMDRHQLLLRVMAVQEVALFQFARRRNPQYFASNRLSTAEQMDPRRWSDEQDEIFLDYSGDVHNPLSSAHEIRNVCIHRNDIDMYWLMPRLMKVMELVLIVGDDSRALEIEILVEQWRMRKSRAEVLGRLASVYRDDVSTDLYPQDRLDRRARALEQLLEAEGVTFDAISATREPAPAPGHWPASMHKAVRAVPGIDDDDQIYGCE